MKDQINSIRFTSFMKILFFCGFVLILCEICMSVYLILLSTKNDKIYYCLFSLSFVLIIMKNIYKNIYGDCYCFVSLVKSQLIKTY